MTFYFNRQQAIKQAKNSPEKIDAQGIINLIKACPHNLLRFVLISSSGVERKNQFPSSWYEASDNSIYKSWYKASDNSIYS